MIWVLGFELCAQTLIWVLGFDLFAQTFRVFLSLDRFSGIFMFLLIGYELQVGYYYESDEILDKFNK